MPVCLNYLWACLIRAVTFSWLTAKYVLKRAFTDVCGLHKTNLIKVWFKSTRSRKLVVMTDTSSLTSTCGEKAMPFQFVIRASAPHREKIFMFSEGKENTGRDVLKPHKTWDNYFTGPGWLQVRSSLVLWRCATDTWKGKWHPVSELPTQPATPRPWQRMAIMTEVLIIHCLYLNVSGLNLSRASQWTLS